ncbi:MAG: hypothetical protein COA57_08770 [Flavobacteriales bacterium]|nr:O-antigen ligase family protein [Bacteroidales bacterium AH-315-I05]PCJ84664.1 MAG: hypothetical protein COA57_08770 [Flavobacteriales bacterium]
MNYSKKIHFYLTLLIAFLFPLSKQVIPPLLILLFINWLFWGNFLKKLKNIQHKQITLFIIGFYVLHVVGLIYTENLEKGLFDVQVKSAILFLPFIYATSVYKFNTKQLHFILISAIAGVFVAVIYCFKTSFFNYFENDPWSIYFFSSRFSAFMHIGYFGLLLNFTICATVYLLLYYQEKLTLRHWVLAGFVILLFVVSLILTTSKNGILTFVVLCVIIGGYLIAKGRRKVLTALLFSLFLLAFVFAIKNSSIVYGRFKKIITVLTAPNENKKTIDSVAARTLAWSTSVEVFKENFFIGTGTGDIKDELLKKYEEKNYTGVLKKKLNSHNQYLQTACALGVVGLMLLLLALFVPFAYSIKQRQYLLSMLMIIIILASITESILEVQIGVVFFSFFVSVLLYAKYDDSSIGKLKVQSNEQKSNDF